jgi:DNA invertase Pin-like site-specific DNA recombinase
MNKTVVTYTRVSSEMQDGDDRVSITEQQADIDKLITGNGWTVVESFRDTEKYIKTRSPNKGKRVQPSGEYDDRPGFLAMLELVKTGSIDAIVCWRDDRLMRHTRVYSLVEEILDEADKVRQGRPAVEIYDATGNKLDRFVLGIKAQIGREENKRRNERIKLGRVGTLKRGLWPGPYPRLGYVTQKADRGIRILLGLEDEVNTVKDIFNWYDSGIGVVKIRKRLIAEDRTQRGHSNGKKARQWGHCSIQSILRSEDYTGRATWSFTDGTPAITITIPQIITPEQFERVQKRMKENKRSAARNTKNVYLLQHIAVCGNCGGKLTVAADTSFYYKYKNGKLFKRYERHDKLGYRYVCGAACRYPEEAHPRPYIFDGVELDNQIWQYVTNKMVTHPELIIVQVHNRQTELRAQGDNLDSEIAQKRRQIAAVDQDKMTYTRQLSREKITEAVYDALIAEADETEVDLREQLNYLLVLRDDQKKVHNTIAYAEDMLANIRQRLPEINQAPEELASLTADTQRVIMLERQTIIRSLVDKVIVYTDGHITIEGLIEVSEFDIATSHFTN